MNLRPCWLSAALVLAACGAAEVPVPRQAVAQAPPRAPVVRGSPRADLGCTPSAPDEQARCAAMGPGYRYGPMPFNNGPARTPEALARDEASYAASAAAGAVPCACLPAGPVPFQSPRP